MNTPELPDIPAFCDICCMYPAGNIVPDTFSIDNGKFVQLTQNAIRSVNDNNKRYKSIEKFRTTHSTMKVLIMVNF
tara:strand:- start:869 stop:1096 length:228 start_codon:yes stop_codon:yes gene_type:complete